MTDLYMQVLSYIAAMWRKRWYIALIAWLICIPGWIGVMALPDRYESAARIYVDTDNLLAPLLRGISVEGNVTQQVDYMQRTLLSRPNIEKLMRMTDLDLKLKTQADRDEMVADIAKRVSISQNQGKNLFSVTFRDASPEISQRVVQSLLSIFVESNVGASRSDIEKARQFLDVQIAQYEKQLQAAETKAADYKRAHLDVLSRGGAGGFQQALDQAKTQRLELQGQLQDAVAKRSSLQKDLASVPQFVQVDQIGPTFILPGEKALPPQLQSLQSRIDEQQRQLDAMKLRYTEKHPDVVAAERQVKDLRRQFDELEKKLASNAKPDGAAAGAAPKQPKSSMPNPVYEQVRLRLVDAEATVSTLERRLEVADIEIKKFENLASTAPTIEAELGTLNRDYGVLHKQYDELLARREAAKMADAVETGGDKIQFRIVDPPQVPSTPSGPPRLLFMSAVLIGSLGAGIVVAFLMSQLDDAFFSLASLRNAVGLPVLGGVSRIVTPGERRMRVIRTATFAASIGALFVTFGALAILLLRDQILSS